MATSSPDHVEDIPELLSASQLARECQVCMGVVNDRLSSGEITPDFTSGRTMLFAAAKLPQFREALRRRH